MKYVKSMKLYFKKEKVFDFNVLWNFQVIWTCFHNIIRKINNQFSLLKEFWRFTKLPKVIAQGPRNLFGRVFTT